MKQKYCYLYYYDIYLMNEDVDEVWFKIFKKF